MALDNRNVTGNDRAAMFTALLESAM